MARGAESSLNHGASPSQLYIVRVSALGNVQPPPQYIRKVCILFQRCCCCSCRIFVDQVVEHLLGHDSGGRSLLVAAIQSGAAQVVDALVEVIDDQKLSIEQVKQ